MGFQDGRIPKMMFLMTKYIHKIQRIIPGEKKLQDMERIFLS